MPSCLEAYFQNHNLIEVIEASGHPTGEELKPHAMLSNILGATFYPGANRCSKYKAFIAHPNIKPTADGDTDERRSFEP